MCVIYGSWVCLFFWGGGGFPGVRGGALKIYIYIYAFYDSNFKMCDNYICILASFFFFFFSSSGFCEIHAFKMMSATVTCEI